VNPDYVCQGFVAAGDFCIETPDLPEVCEPGAVCDFEICYRSGSAAEGNACSTRLRPSN